MFSNISSMSLGQVFSTLFGAAIAIAPTVMPFIPQPYGAIAGVGIAALGNIYHLLQPAPAAPAVVAPKA